MKTILNYIAGYASEPEYGDRFALIDDREELSYAKLWNRIVNYADDLKKRGVKKGDCVLIRCTQNCAYLTSIFAVQYLGAVCVPLEKDAGYARIEEIQAETGAKYCIDHGEGFKDCVMLKQPDQSFDEVAAYKEFSFPDVDDVAEILYSTGTTGKSKGIVLTHGNNIALAENITEGVEMGRNNMEVIPMPLSHSHGYRRALANLYYGNTVIIIGGITVVKRLFDMLDKYNVTALDLAPSLLSMIFDRSGDKIGDYSGQLDYVQLGSAPLTEEDKTHLRGLLPNTRLYNFYGSTESGCSCILNFQDDKIRPQCIGKATKNAEFVFVDDDRKPADADRDHPAFIATAGAQNMKEYYKAPELTASVMRDGYIYTNDLGYMDDEGYIYCLGRADDVINYSGIKISPEEIECEAVKYPGIRDAACVPMADKTYGQVPKLYVSLEDNETGFSDTDCLEFLKTRLDRNKIPKLIEIIPEIPRTSNGKLQRKKLIDR